jgi:hypothetical protein
MDHQNFLADYRLATAALAQWFSIGALQEVARCAANITKVCFENEKEPICIGIFTSMIFIFIY